MLPSTKLYSDRSRAADATHEVQREHEYKDATDPDTLVPPEERQKAYKVPRLPSRPALCIAVSQPRRMAAVMSDMLKGMLPSHT